MDKMKKIYAIVGAGSFARDIMPILLESFPKLEQEQIFFVTSDPQNDMMMGRKIISEEQFLSDKSDKYFTIAIANSKAREAISKRMIEGGAKPISLIAKKTTIYDNSEIDEGAIICAYSIVSSNAKIGKFFQSNFYSYVAHDCEIGDFVTFAPKVNCNGNVKIEDHAYIGTGAIIIQGTNEKPLVIGEGSIVGMGSVVTKDVPAFSTVYGVPAKVMKTAKKTL